MQSLIRASLATMVSLCVLLLASTASAQNVPRLQGQVTDLTSQKVLSSGQSQVDAALQQLLNSQDVQLFVLFVDSTGGATVTDFANAVARQNSLGGNDALLVVSLGDRTDSLWRDQQSLSGLTDQELQQVLTRRVEPSLGQGDFPGAVVGAAQGLGQVAGAGQTDVGRGSSSSSDRAQEVIVVISIMIIGVICLWIWTRRSGGRGEREAAQRAAQDTEQLAQKANALLIDGDEALRNAKEEMGFAEAQFSEEDVAPFRQAVDQASSEMKAAFTLRQQLDDDIPEDAATRRRMVQEIIERTQRAQALLEEQQRRIEELRAVERNAPQILAAMPSQIATLQARVARAKQTFDSLQRYAASSWASVAGNGSEAEKRLAHARDAVAVGQQALAAGNTSEAAASARSAQHALTEATQLLDAIDTLDQSLRQAEQTVGSQLSTARASVAAAKDAVGAGRSDLVARIAEAESNVQQAEQELKAEKPDFLAVQRMAAAAQTAAHDVLATIQGEAARTAQEGETLRGQIQVAEASYDRASGFIAARRHGIGREARTRLAEAERHLDQAHALSSSDVPSAIDEARRAHQLAEEAYELAAQDFNDRYGGGGIFGRGGPGIIIPFPIGGWSGGGWGGSPWGGWGGGSSWGGGGGGGAVGGGWGGGGGGAVGGHW